MTIRTMTKKDIIKEIRDKLFQRQDVKYGDFLSKLIPNADRDYFIGVRTPELRKIAKDMVKNEGTEVTAFISDLPHKYFEENQLHAFIIALGKDFDVVIEEVNVFLRFVNNWATCDQLSPKVFKEYRCELLPYIKEWINSGETYIVRFGIGMLMEHFLDEDFKVKYPKIVASVKSEEYYVNMMIAWYFATALAKQYDAIIPFIENRKLDPWTHNKTIQKAVESYRITSEQKAYLRSLR